MLRSIEISGRTINYELIRKKVKNINLRIHNDGSIVVSCNNRVSVDHVERFIREQSEFIIRGLMRVNNRVSNACRPVNYSDGETVSVFGDKCTIKVLLGKSNRVLFDYPTINLIVKDPMDFDVRRRTYDNWKKKLIKTKILEMCEYYYPYFKGKGVVYPDKISFRTMTSKWGCCRPTIRSLTFNNNLFEVPEECIAYVVVHEFAHFLEANHSPRFYKQVEGIMPDYKARRKLLNEY